MKLPLSPTSERHTMDTGSAFSQGKKVARLPTKKCLPKKLDMTKVVEEVVGDRHGTEQQLQQLVVHTLSRRMQPCPKKAVEAAAWRSDSAGSEQGHQPWRPN